MSKKPRSVWDRPVSPETSDHLNRLAKIIQDMPAGVLAETLRKAQETESEQAKAFQVKPNPWFWLQEID